LAYNTVLRPFANRGSDLSEVTQLNPAFWRLTRERLRCLNRLRKLEWDPLTSAKNFIYMANCMPWRLPVSGDVTACCRRWAICPWCWGRERVRPVWHALRRCLRLQAQAAKGRFISFNDILWSFTPKPARGASIREEDLVTVATDFLDQRLKMVGSVLSRNGSLGWVACGYVYPSKSRGFIGRVRAWAVPDDDFNGPVLFRLLRMRVSSESGIFDKDVARVLGGELRFPRAVFRADPVKLKSCLEAVSRVRLLRSGGAARKSNEEEP
jgi:hypothetical protein